ncbi:hypothetical protein M427DRAFT_417465 [Gonapodya prolifera JEL478]|uniref:Uncharacterized protein n=1 Tax=Gonapodya prolifera (strain JEL478) TaxID=1344416 RepID=A0A139A5C6_GONPJ|nr:hypothetical protein M427DRAFT_417465 [Gonapodya prolifera JEL478]|eukprot:KXS11954.1 hypothetical protein M427DRAFT_417465 [Gonapodya prolifera JEL478]
MIDCFCKVNRLGLQLHIHTFTESDRGCYVTQSPVGLTQPQVANYVQTKLKLSNPPDLHVSAHGGDGPENHTAAIADLTTKFGKDANVVCFMITDATPHYKSHGASTEAKKEAEWLSNNGFETDIFKVGCPRHYTYIMSPPLTNLSPP